MEPGHPTRGNEGMDIDITVKDGHYDICNKEIIQEGDIPDMMGVMAVSSMNMAVAIAKRLLLCQLSQGLASLFSTWPCMCGVSGCLASARSKQAGRLRFQERRRRKGGIAQFQSSPNLTLCGPGRPKL